jgi:hypothetical protein
LDILDIFGHFWTFLDIFGHFWTFLFFAPFPRNRFGVFF